MVEFSPIQFTKRRSHHRTMLIVSAIIIALSFLLSNRDTSGETIVSWGGISLPPLCASRAWFGIECPGCGLTRSFVALASGNVGEAFRYHRLGWLMFGVVLLQIPYRSYMLWELRSSVVERSWPTYFGYLLIPALIGNWVLQALSI